MTLEQLYDICELIDRSMRDEEDGEDWRYYPDSESRDWEYACRVTRFA